MKVVFEQYLPLSWSGGSEGKETGEEPSQVGVAPGQPQVAAVNLIRAMCVAGRHITSQLVSTFRILEPLLKKVSHF